MSDHGGYNATQTPSTRSIDISHHPLETSYPAQTRETGATNILPNNSDHSIAEPESEPSFQPNDPSNPRNWPEWRKWSIVAAITLIDLTVSWGASGYSPAQMEMRKEFGASAGVGTLGLSLYILGLALGPMTLAPLSEYFGRSPIYIVSYGIFLLFLLGSALVQSLAGFLVLRVLSGWFAAVTIANFGGTIADLWPAHQTGPPMSLFLWAATCGSPSGYFLMSFVAATHGFRAVFWALLGICGGFWLIMIFTIRETRHSILVERQKKKEGVSRPMSTLSKLERFKLATAHLVQNSLKRPFLFLATESIIIFCALYNGLLYGISFLFNSAFNIVFGLEGHRFGTIDVGLCFLSLVIGITLGPITNALFQEPHFQKKLKQNNYKNTPEGRVFMSKIAAVTFPISLFWFAWTTYTSIHWIVPLLAAALWGWSFYTLILMTYCYTEDSYKTYSASALAGIGLIRNLAGAGFPLFGTQIYHKLGNQGATSLIAGIACLLVPIPFVLFRFGSRLRERSPWAKVHVEVDEREEVET